MPHCPAPRFLARLCLAGGLVLLCGLPRLASAGSLRFHGVFGVINEDSIARTLCGSSNALDGDWHHVAVQRRGSDGWMGLYIDGQLEVR